jgi:serine/threonine-protein phosphatase PP1 catalytic subunit
MSVSGELLCSFELLKPLDSAALKNHIKKGRKERNSILNSPVSCSSPALLRNAKNKHRFSCDVAESLVPSFQCSLSDSLCFLQFS